MGVHSPYAKVPTDSNLSDGPSRFCCDKVLVMGAVECSVDGDACWAERMSLFEMWGEDQALSLPNQ